MAIVIDEHKPTRFLRRPEALDRGALGASQIDNLERTGKFPKRVKVGEKAAAWVEAEVEEWIESRTAASRGRPRLDMQVSEYGANFLFFCRRNFMDRSIATSHRRNS